MIIIILLFLCLAAFALLFLGPAMIRERLGCSGCMIVTIVTCLIGAAVTVAIMESS
ncbi:hypothetical protein OG357_12325 [Streptomyces sp. NBC_01255]|uniref:hypothetical protein n=1 Tax=Streptomyces sp. NBC_01255 TaxID=2903798 RepID=UPI002E32864B|nr:hypothetical protein [Streptomyces sp. NBC_01255]